MGAYAFLGPELPNHKYLLQFEFDKLICSPNEIYFSLSFHSPLYI